jgi:hypothetical protein
VSQRKELIQDQQSDRRYAYEHQRFKNRPQAIAETLPEGGSTILIGIVPHERPSAPIWAPNLPD